MDKTSRDARFERDARKTASKYDFVKVKVWLGEERAHYYVLSRFLISRSLTVTKIPHLKAVKIALELKKFCVDNGMLDISQAQMEEVLFQIMHSRGFTDTYVRRFRMVTRFHLQRRPLVIFISGTACTGKSTLAQQLAARLNLPNVLQTDIIYQLLQASPAAALDHTPLWRRGDLSVDGELIAEYHRECDVVRRGIDADLGKSIRDGKSFIIEGLHLDPGRYMHEFGRHGMSQLQPAALTPQPSGADALQPQADQAAAHTEAAAVAAAEQQAQAEQQPARQADVQQPPATRRAEAAGAETTHASSAAVQTAPVPDPSAFAAPEQQQHQPESPQQPPKPQISSPSRSGSRQSSGMATQGSTRQRIKDRLRRLPGRAASVHDEPLATQPPDVPAHVMHRPPPRRAASAISSATPRVLFALRQDAGTALQGGIGEAEDGAGGLRPRLAPWPAAKALLESLRPYDHHHALDAALTRLHLRHKEAPIGANGHNGSSSLQPPEQQTASGRQQPLGESDAEPLMGPQGAAAAGVNSASASDATTAVASAEADGMGRRQMDGMSGVRKGGGAASRLADAAELATPDAAAMAAPPEPEAQLGPVFVPIVLAMDEANHAPLLDEWLARQPASPGGCSNEEALSRVCMLQNHFCAYQAQAVPVVRISIDGFARTLDGLHDYLLQCMELAMGDEP